ncbi:MAG: hypothetical protein K9G72_20015 [Rhodobacteraceae bacterium]|nr:hypothetical protein [Paracoccaceae bacterium]
MNTTIRATLDDLFLWYVYGVGTSQTHWGNFRAGDGFYTSQWLTIADRAISEPTKVPLIELSSQGSYFDPRDADAVTFDLSGSHLIAIRDVEYVDSSLATNTTLLLASHYGFTTDGSLNEISANIGNHEMVFTTAIKDSSLMLGDGWDVVTLSDQLDVPGTQYWALIRRADNALDAYSLLTGLRVRMEDGAESRNGNNGYTNFGEVEQIYLADSRYPSDPDRLYNPGGVDLPTGGDRGLFENIDLRSDGDTFTDSFNLAYFNFIRYTSDNVWAGESTIHDGSIYSSPSDGTVTVAKNGFDAPVLEGQLSVMGQSRNGTHDLIVAEQAPGEAVDGKFHLYSFNVESGLYNEFNEVFLGTGANEVSDKSSIVGTDWSDRVALYGFGGEDVLIGGAGWDYLFGGESAYNQLNAGEIGNQVTGGLGADYFGVGNTNSAGVVTGANATIGTVGTTGEFHQGYATDVIMDWHAGVDTIVVLSNGVAVIAGLRNHIETLSLSHNNIIDFRDYAAVATSDQDFDGARGGDGWDASKSLDYIYSNQADRDANSIANEDDRTVVNDGLIVARGLDGDDTLYGSSGNDYLYGNKGAALIVLSEGGTDRVYFDTFDSTLVSTRTASIYVADFDRSDDQVFLNKRVIDAFSNVYDNTSNTRSLSAVDVSGTYRQAIAYDRSINFLHDKFYQPSIYDTNANHRSNDGRTAFGDNSGTNQSSGFGGADGTTFKIGVGMVAAGYALLAIPFVGPALGLPLIASGAVLGAIGVIAPTVEHENATFSGYVGNYLNVITSDTLETVTTTAATSVFRNSDDVRFLDFFGASNAGDGYVPVIEFTAHAGQGIHGYFALHSAGGDNETFVYLVSSSDNLVDNSEAIKVAEINGHLTAADFKVYDGEADIYNAGAEAEIVLRTPTIVAVVDQNGDFAVQAPNDAGNAADNDKLIEKGGTPNPNDLEIVVQLNGERANGTTINIYDGRTLIFSGNEVSSTENSGGLVSAAYNTSTNTFTITDGRGIGTVAFDTATGEPSSETTLDGVDNNLILQDSIVNYSIELVDGVTGITTRTSSGAITVSGGNTLIDGGTQTGSGMDILNISGTVDYINETGDASIVGIETIMLAAADTNGSADAGNAAIDDGDDSPVLNLSKQSDGFKVYGSTIADQITGSTGNDDISGLGGGDTIQLLSSGAGLETSGADRVRFNYASDRLGSDTGYDIVLGMHSDDELFIEASATLDTDNNPDTAPETVRGFDDRDGDATRLMYESGTLSSNTKVASGTELLVIESAGVASGAGLAARIADALGSAFDLAGLDGTAPSATTGGGTDSSVLFAVESDVVGTYWFGRYDDVGNDDSAAGADIEIFASVQGGTLDNFWLPTVEAPQALTITLPADNGRTEASGTLYTTNSSFTVGGLQSGNSVYYSLDGGTNWSTAPADQTSITLNEGSNDIRVRQVDGNNYSGETTSGSRLVSVDSTATGPYYDIDQITLLTFGGGVYLNPTLNPTDTNAGIFSGSTYYVSVVGPWYLFDFDSAATDDQGSISFGELSVRVNVSGDVPDWVDLTEWDGTGVTPSTYYYLNPNSASQIPGAILVDVGSYAVERGPGADLQIEISGTVSDSFISNLFTINHYIDVL